MNSAEETKERILAAGLRLSERYGWRNLKRDAVASEANCSPALVSAHFGLMEDFRSEVMRRAVESHIEPVIAEGVALRHPAALAAFAQHVVRLDGR